jgi:prepilin-type N-terminal cleavage/methylation domain-containing protein
MACVGSTTVGRRRSDDGGFTLIESLAASAILLVIAVGVITTLITTGGWYAKARLRTQAFTVANQVMATVLSRNYADIHYGDSGETWPGAIFPEMSWPSTGTAQFNVQTSWETTTDPKTGLEMKKIEVSAIPVAQSLDPTVTIIRYASGWQQTGSLAEKYLVTVAVRLVPYNFEVPEGQTLKGARVQLLDVNDLHEAYYATTDDTNVATFHNVLEGEYFLTSDPRFGTDLRPVYFPKRITPTHGGSGANVVLTVNSYDLSVTKSSTGALLKVGAYKTEGWTVVDDQAQPPEVPYKFPTGLVIYASPVLNAGTGTTGYYGMSGNLYPDETKLAGVPYSATVNAYGVAAVPIPWITNSLEGQYWKVWCRTKDSENRVTIHAFTTLASSKSGGWDNRVQRPEGAFDPTPEFGKILQFPRLGEGAIAVNDPTVPPDSAFQ